MSDNIEGLQARYMRYAEEKARRSGRVLSYPEFVEGFNEWVCEHPEYELEDDPYADMPGFRG